MIKLIKQLLLFLFITFLPYIVFSEINSKGKGNWIVYYSDKAPLKAFDNYELLVFDSRYHPQLLPLSDRGKTLLGYISLGEVEKTRSYYEDVKKSGILLKENKFWKDSFFVDVRNPLWVSRVIEEIIPDILHQRFNGVFLDTLDNPIELERSNPKKYVGMVEASIKLVKAIRYHYPNIKIMMNRAYEILPQVEKYIDMELGESVFTDYDFKKKSYHFVNKNLYLKQVNLLKKTKHRRPELRILSLDYWNADDKKGVKKIYLEQRKNGFEPYVSTIELNKIVNEP